VARYFFDEANNGCIRLRWEALMPIETGDKHRAVIFAYLTSIR
jgi:hypothetical protein